MDITALKQTEEAWRNSEEKYRLLIEHANKAIFIAQEDVIKFPNPKTVEIRGCSAEDFSRIPFARFIHPEDREMVIQRHRRRLAGEGVPTQ
jgi:PAS domain S-box-containing protein